MLLLSGGWPFDVSHYIRGDETRILLDSPVYRGRDLLRLLTDTANQLGYTVYPVDVPGMRRELPQSAQCRPSRPSQSTGVAPSHT